MPQMFPRTATARSQDKRPDAPESETRLLWSAGLWSALAEISAAPIFSRSASRVHQLGATTGHLQEPKDSGRGSMERF